MHSNRPNIILTDDQLRTLRQHIPQFRVGKAEDKAKITRVVTNSLKNSWGENQPKFDKKEVETVCAPSAKMNHSFSYYFRSFGIIYMMPSNDRRRETPSMCELNTLFAKS
jgi:hypothetical protein